ncbi:MAG: DotD/TraH family lipoprotein [Alphaproteobacteria bacterium]|nr:MAG: DotD/TraH family lipoprotein [Alphaproteobacteria bacterium]
MPSTILSASRRSLVLFGALLAVVGCAEDARPVVPLVSPTDPVTLRLAKAAERAANALDNISRIDQVRTPMPPPPNFVGVPQQMLQPVTLTWTGPVEQVAQQLAEKAGYTFDKTGAPPPVPITVALDVFERPIIQVLQDIGLQIGRRAEMVVDGQTRRVEIRYAPVEGLL